MEVKTYLDRTIEFAWLYGPKVLTAVLLLFGGLWLIRRITRGFEHFLRARNMDAGLRPFFTSLVDVTMKVILVFMVANTIGLATTSFIAIFSAIAFSIGLALQGSLGNFASGILILLFRPFKIGDLLTVADKTGKVVAIQTFSTILKTSTGKKIIIPNGKMTDGPVENIAEGTELQAEVTLLLHPATSLEKIRSLAEQVAARCPHALPDKPVSVQVAGITRNDMKTQIGVWIMGEHYEDTMSFLYEELKSTFEMEEIALSKVRRQHGV